jgi:adenylate cyclase
MVQHLEIEKKFLITQPPKGWKLRASTRIVQGYFPVAGQELEIRLRCKGEKHFVTFKGGQGERRLEEEFPISVRVFRALWPFTRAARIAKRRYKIPSGDHTIEMDVYQGPHRGLMTAEIEFASKRASRSFEPPDWFGREVTANPRYANVQLARRRSVPRDPARR